MKVQFVMEPPLKVITLRQMSDGIYAMPARLKAAPKRTKRNKQRSKNEMNETIRVIILIVAVVILMWRWLAGRL